MSISNNTKVGAKQDLTYNLKKTLPNKPSLKPVVSNHPLIDDFISISDEAKALLGEEKKKYMGLNNYTPEELEEMYEQLKASTDDSNNPLKIKLQCLQIAMRIISGDNVPSKDRAFLAEHEPEMLSNALLLRRRKEKPKTHKSLLEDEETSESIDLSAPISSERSEGVSEESVSSDGVEVSIDIEA